MAGCAECAGVAGGDGGDACAGGRGGAADVYGGVEISLWFSRGGAGSSAAYPRGAADFICGGAGDLCDQHLDGGATKADGEAGIDFADDAGDCAAAAGVAEIA